MSLRLPFRSVRFSPEIRKAVAVTALVAVAGCGGGDGEAVDQRSPQEKAAAAARETAPAQAPLTIKDPWVKAAERGGSAVYGTLVNATAKDITVVSASSPVAPQVALHRTVGAGGEMKMQAVGSGGLVVPAKGTVALKPGGYHLSVAKLAKPIKAGGRVAFTLVFKDGANMTFMALARAAGEGR